MEIGMGGVRARGGLQQTEQTLISTVFDKNTIVYDRIRRKYGRLRRYTLRLRPPFFSVFLRIWSRRNTIVILNHVIRKNTVVYGAYIACIRSYTGSYMVVNDRIRSS